LELETCRNNDTVMDTVMIARILRAERCQLLVCDCATNQEVVVHANNACCFSCGECVCIRYSGAMTMSLPPQISATCVARHCGN